MTKALRRFVADLVACRPSVQINRSLVHEYNVFILYCNILQMVKKELLQENFDFRLFCTMLREN